MELKGDPHRSSSATCARVKMMLLRKDEESVIAIPQPSHAWLSGQLARGWGNERFAAPAPKEEVCLAAELHDIGWLTWETSPVCDERSGLPQEFFALPPQKHLALWKRGVRHACTFGRYPALLVSLHADTIYTRHFDFNKASPEVANAVRAFLDRQRRFQTRMANSLREDPKTCKQAAPETIESNRLLIAALDKMSLEICWGVKTITTIPDVPAATGEKIELSLFPGPAETVMVDPWPFGAERVTVQAEGKRLRGRFSRQTELQRVLGKAETVQVSAVLRQA